MSSNTAASTAIPKNIEDNSKQMMGSPIHVTVQIYIYIHTHTHKHINAVSEGKTQNRMLYHEH